MRPILLAACVLASTGTALAQDGQPQPFLSTELSARATKLDGVEPAVGFDVTFGARSWRGLQPIVQGGRLIDVTPADLIRRSSGPGFARQTNTWYGAAGARFGLPGAWRFQPYAEGSAGVAHMDSEVETGANPFHVRQVVPLSTFGVGVDVRFGRHFTIDAGYKVQRFFGDADVMRRAPRLRFGVRF
jgi:hypothetical protein